MAYCCLPERCLTLSRKFPPSAPQSPLRPSTRRVSMAAKRKARKAKKAPRRAAKKTAKKSKRKPSAAFMKPMTPTPALAAVIGSSPMPRTEVTKKLWGYIKRKGLQDSKNRRMINADAALKPVFAGKSSVNMFEMTKLVAKHLK